MIRIIMNIGYVVDGASSGILSDFPMSWEFENISVAFDWLRTQMFTILTWAKNCHVPKSSICLYLRLENEVEYWEYKIRCKNIREYKEFMSYTDEEVEAKIRENTINSVLSEN